MLHVLLATFQVMTVKCTLKNKTIKVVVTTSLENATGATFKEENGLEGEIISQRNAKFYSTDLRNEKILIPTIQLIVNEFGSSHYVARHAKRMVEEKGFLSCQYPKHGKHLLQGT